ncbi:hypothetical protein CEXT_251521 [Caerostris extrusa]|uniref:Uncharacterized protein n=1 Tax=Caerostris extrusa TaxID=172846 RepID=A0AAV4NI37_CAEEX|nr:hypothetical protein CEXT_251521 [Caerostris extrusa]
MVFRRCAVFRRRPPTALCRCVRPGISRGRAAFGETCWRLIVGHQYAIDPRHQDFALWVPDNTKAITAVNARGKLFNGSPNPRGTHTMKTSMLKVPNPIEILATLLPYQIHDNAHCCHRIIINTKSPLAGGENSQQKRSNLFQGMFVDVLGGNCISRAGKVVS